MIREFIKCSNKLLKNSASYSELQSRMQKGSKAQERLLDARDEPAQQRTQGLSVAIFLLLCALLLTFVMLGASYQQNVLLQKRLSGKLTR
jgi:hypothetical protein